MGRKSRRGKTALEALHNVEGGRVKKSQKAPTSQETAATQKIKSSSPNEPPQLPAKDEMGWTPEIRDYVNRSFAPINVASGITGEQIGTKLKNIITKATQNGKLYTTNWKSLQLPHQMIQGDRTGSLLAITSLSSSHSVSTGAGSIKSAPAQENVESSSKVRLSSTKQSQPPKCVILDEDQWHPSKLTPNLTRLGFSKGFEAFNIKDLSESSKGLPHLCNPAHGRRPLSFFTHCPKIHTLSITGNDKGKGNIKGLALLELKKDKEMAKQLRKLDLVDQQSLDHKYLKSVGTARKQLVITEGDSSEKSYDFGSISTWKGGKLKLDNSSFDDWF
ncbi:hypothetical protein LTS07_010814 [Exophiala sideris]|uniref:Uncharacterized protein n=1 Tax=Exophiala sideris TaxID=1016849 RepID=A0ABR0IW19_9EURO|nr:hypothetical protein LTS07_010814 [Exophiala sideris]KAK5024853.1 hypothetical protein LTR13_010696 [Exophiala sideris]KAK5049781.1 hypothetical protein LTR69_010838 [Exophiala sideris]KAK5176761.1 hypothetical protein LTR44_010704 [Eurotiomycetes sp. CCFEE 6388]